MTVPPNYREKRSHRTISLALPPPNIQTYLHRSLSWLPSCLVPMWYSQRWKKGTTVRWQTCAFQGEKGTILFRGMLKQSHIQFVTNTIVCSLVLNNYSIYKFNKALVPQKNTNESSFETDRQQNPLYTANFSPKNMALCFVLFYKTNHNC